LRETQPVVVTTCHGRRNFILLKTPTDPSDSAALAFPGYMSSREFQACWKAGSIVVATPALASGSSYFNRRSRQQDGGRSQGDASQPAECCIRESPGDDLWRSGGENKPSRPEPNHAAVAPTVVAGRSKSCTLHPEPLTLFPVPCSVKSTPETRNPTPETRNPKPETRNPKLNRGIRGKPGRRCRSRQARCTCTTTRQVF